MVFAISRSEKGSIGWGTGGSGVVEKASGIGPDHTPGPDDPDEAILPPPGRKLKASPAVVVLIE